MRKHFEQKKQENFDYPNLLGRGVVRIIESSDNGNRRSWLVVIHIIYEKKTGNILFVRNDKKNLHYVH